MAINKISEQVRTKKLFEFNESVQYIFNYSFKPFILFSSFFLFFNLVIPDYKIDKSQNKKNIPLRSKSPLQKANNSLGEMIHKLPKGIPSLPAINKMKAQLPSKLSEGQEKLSKNTKELKQLLNNASQMPSTNLENLDSIKEELSSGGR